MARQQIFEGQVNLCVGERSIKGSAVFHQPDGTFILAVEDEEVAQELIQQLARDGAFREPIRLGELLAKSGVRHLGHEICLIPRQPHSDYQTFIRALQATVTVTQHWPWTFN